MWYLPRIELNCSFSLAAAITLEINTHRNHCLRQVRCLSLLFASDSVPVPLSVSVSFGPRASALKHGLSAVPVGLLLIYLATSSVGSITNVNNTVNTTRHVRKNKTKK